MVDSISLFLLLSTAKTILDLQTAVSLIHIIRLPAVFLTVNYMYHMIEFSSKFLFSW